MLADLRKANRARQAEWPGNEHADLAFRAIELAGETGEACEAVKKWLRLQRGIKGSVATLEDVANEFADVVIALDLLADSMGINLADAIVEKFNATSRKYGLETRMDWPTIPQPVRPGSDAPRQERTLQTCPRCTCSRKAGEPAPEDCPCLRDA